MEPGFKPARCNPTSEMIEVEIVRDNAFNRAGWKPATTKLSRETVF